MGDMPLTFIYDCVFISMTLQSTIWIDSVKCFTDVGASFAFSRESGVRYSCTKHTNSIRFELISLGIQNSCGNRLDSSTRFFRCIFI